MRVKDGDGDKDGAGHVYLLLSNQIASKKKETFTVTNAWQTLSEQNRYLNKLPCIWSMYKYIGMSRA